MFTLLPNEYRKRILKAYKVRLLVLSSFFVVLFLAILITSFLPSYIAVNSEYQKLVSEEEFVRKSIIKNNDDGLSLTIKNLKANIDLIIRLDRPALKEVTKVFKYENSDITLTKIDYRTTDIGGYTILLSGVSRTRKSLSDFAKSLRGENSFKNVDLPISDLAKESDVTFNIKINGKFEL